MLELIVIGKLNKQIAAELGAAEKTIKVHRGRVMAKLQRPLGRRARHADRAGGPAARRTCHAAG